MEGNAPIGQKVEIKVVKNKVGNPFGVVETSLYFHTGFDKQAELVDEAIKAGVVDKGGAWYYLNKGTEEELRFQGKNAVVEYYRTSPEAYENMLERLLASEDGIVIQVEPEDPANETLEEDFSE
jgi:recombination protein RecA